MTDSERIAQLEEHIAELQKFTEVLKPVLDLSPETAYRRPRRLTITVEDHYGVTRRSDLDVDALDTQILVRSAVDMTNARLDILSNTLTEYKSQYSELQ